MKKRIWKYLLIAFFLSSCVKDSDITVSFTNLSDYDINQFVFNLSKERDTISLERGQESNHQFKYVNHWAHLFSEPTLNLWIKKYSDSNGTYSSNVGIAKPRHVLKREEINRIKILYDSKYERFIFELEQ